MIIGSIATELEALRHLLELRSLLVLLTVVVVAAVLWKLLGGAPRLAARMGMRHHQRLQRFVDLLRPLVMLGAGLIVFGRPVTVAPQLGTVLALVATAIVAVAHLDTLRSFMVGVTPRWRERVREGDYVTVAGTTGIVRRFGLLAVEVDAQDGAVTYLPNHTLRHGAVTVQRARDTVTVSALIPNVAATSDILNRFRSGALLSPYRVPGSPVLVAIRDGGINIQLQTWSVEASRSARRQLLSQAAATLHEDAVAAAEQETAK